VSDARELRRESADAGAALSEPKRNSVGMAKAVFAIFRKDLQIELRTREIVVTAGFFAILVTVMESLAFPDSPDSASGALWIPLTFASLLALGRTWQRERDESALTGMLISPVPRTAIYLGKALGVFAFLIAIDALLVPLVGLFFHIDLGAILGPLLLLLILGTLGVACIGTLFGAMTVRTRARELVLASVLFPLLSPVLLVGVSGTSRLIHEGCGFSGIHDYALLLLVFDAAALAGSIAVFGTLMED
jgi:heme exporter protein B